MTAYCFVQYNKKTNEYEKNTNEYEKNTNEFLKIRVLSELTPAPHKQFGFAFLGKIDGDNFNDTSQKANNIRKGIVPLLTVDEKKDYNESMSVLGPMFYELIQH